MFLPRTYRLVEKTKTIWHQSSTLFTLKKKASSRLCKNAIAVNLHHSSCSNSNTGSNSHFIQRMARTKLGVTFYCAHLSTLKKAYGHDMPTSAEADPVNSNNNEEAEKQQQNQKSWRLMKYSLIFFGGSLALMGLSVVYEISKPKYDEEGKIIEDEFSDLPYLQQVYKRLTKEFTYYKKLVQEPSRDKLLPDPLQHPYIQPPYTLVLELTDVLVHPDWTYQTGWRFKKRPGIDAFLEAVAPPQFEIVVYTAEQGLTVFPILDALDQNGYIMYRLVRDATRFVDGHHVKDLDALNRDLSKVIVIDWNPESVKFHPENALLIPRWKGNDNDTAMYDLAAFLKTIYATSVDDVREVLSYYRQFDNPLEMFRENQRKLLLQLEQEETKALMDENKPMSKWRPSFLKRH